MDQQTAIIVGVVITALIVLAIVLKPWKYLKLNVDTPYGKLDIEGRGNGDQLKRSGISATNVISREGGIRAEDRTGTAISLDGADALKDVTLIASLPKHDPSKKK